MSATFQVWRTDLADPALCGMGFTSREQAGRCAEMWRQHYASKGTDMELEVREVTGQQQEDAVRAIRAFYGFGRVG